MKSFVRLCACLLCVGLLALPVVVSAAQPADYKFTPAAAPPEPDAIFLYSGVAPGSETHKQREQWSAVNGELVVRNVTRPTITPFLPDPAKATGAAVIVAPGGAFMMLAMDNEGWPVAKWLTEHGIAAFVLKYRLDATPVAEDDFMRAAAARFGAAAKAGADKAPPIHAPLAIDDAVAALKLVRSRAGEWHVDPRRVGMLGFSAGAMTTLQTALRDDPAQLPDFIGLIYGPMTSVKVTSNTPPAFIAVAADDPLFGNSGFGIVDSWKAAKRPVELHYYERGDHGFGMRKTNTTSDLWTTEFQAWMQARGLLERSAAPAGAAIPPAILKEIREAEARYRALPDTVGTGAYPAIKEEITALPEHVIYRPRDLAALGRQKLGVVVWGNGGCSDDGASTRLHLLEIASHGYLTIANGTIKSGPGTNPPPQPAAPPAPGTLPPPATSAEQLRQAIDWAVAENSRQDSPFHGRIDTRAIAVSGWSCGGLQAIQVSADPRVRTVIIHNSGIFNEEYAKRMPQMDLGKGALKRLHTPVLYVLGGPTDIAYANGMDDVKRIDHVPVAVANLDVGHGGTFYQWNGGKAAQIAVAWLDWQLRGDKRAAAMFAGGDCGLCTSAEWTFERRGF